MENNLAKILCSLLANNIISFTYRKVDGTIREAIGTRNLYLAGQYVGPCVVIREPKTGKNNPNAYYDLEKMDWRSFRPELVISICGINTDEIKGIKGNRIIKTNSDEEVDIPINLVGGSIGGFGGNMKDEIHKSLEKLGKDITFVSPNGTPSGKDNEPTNFDLNKIAKAVGVSLPHRGGGRVSIPICTSEGDVALPIGSVSVEDFAKLVARYVVDLLAYRLTID